MVTIDEFKKVDLRIGTIIEIEDFPEAKNSAYKLKINFGGFGIKQSSAKITDLYNKKDLINRQIVAVVNFPTKKVANYNSEVLVLGADSQYGGIILLEIEKPMQNGLKVS